MNKNWKIALGILALVVAFGTGFLVGRVSFCCGMRPCPGRECLPPMPPCHRPHRRMCPPPAAGEFPGECERKGQRFDDGRPMPPRDGGDMHIRSREMNRAPRR